MQMENDEALLCSNHMISVTRWRDQQIVPMDYEDLSALVKLARQAREVVVEFDWAFSRDDLLCLRRAVYEWGSRVRGSYRCFDARVLTAINQALGESDSIFVLNEPKNYEWLDCKPSCVPDGDLFRLQGHASFDLVIGYGEAGVQEFGDGRAFLGPAVRATITTSVGMLGWDLHRLQEARFQSVRNALYGLPLSYGLSIMESAHGPELEVPVHFHGPFSALNEDICRSLFTDGIAAKSGVYFWTIDVEGKECLWYVGQTRRSFGERMGEHIAGILSGQYPTYDPTELRKSKHVLAKGSVKGMWPQTLPSILRNYETLMPNIIALIRLMRFHLAPLVGDAQLHDRVEGAIGRYYKTHTRPELRDFFYPGLKLPAAIPYDSTIRLLLSSEAPIAGLPLEILEPPAPLPGDIRQFVESTSWTFAKTYAATWPHEYVVKTTDNAPMILALARHIFEYGVAGRFYSQVRRYHHEGGKVYWSMDPTPETTDLVNRCDETQTYEARLAAGTLPNK
jgi:hypothetical protein